MDTMITYLFKCFIQNEVVHVLLAIHDVSCPPSVCKMLWKYGAVQVMYRFT